MTKNNGVGSGRNAPRLPKQQLTILALCRFAEPVAMTSVSRPIIPAENDILSVLDAQKHGRSRIGESL